MIYIIEDNKSFADCLLRYCRPEKAQIFDNVIDAINQIDEDFPSLIFLDILLTGPDGFTFLNELASYRDTAKIPTVIVSSIDFENKDLSAYGVVGILNKDTLMPEEVRKYVKRYSY